MLTLFKLSLPKLLTPFGADKTMTAVISGEADIGFMGSEASIYTYTEGALPRRARGNA